MTDRHTVSVHLIPEEVVESGRASRRMSPGLLRQPGGFEGVVSILEERDPLDLSSVERPEPSESSLQFDSVATPEMPRHRRDEPVASLNELAWLIALGFPIPQEGLDHPGTSSRPYTPWSGLIEREKSKAKSAVASFMAPTRSPLSSAWMTRRATAALSSDIAYSDTSSVFGGRSTGTGADTVIERLP